jgi:carboxylesterase type B
MAVMISTVLLLSLIAVISGNQTNNPYFKGYHTTKIGISNIGGTKETVKLFGADYNLRVYRGIPYAEPPVGKLRFKSPVPKAVPDGYNAIGFGDSCVRIRRITDFCTNITLITDPMYHTRQSEDCLYLNVYSPADASPTKLKAVLVFFQKCGGWMMADGQQHNGMVLSALGDIIVVTFNYRVGAFGFLSTGIKGTGANFGLQDQHEVLRWVNSNIGYLGGDKDRVTIFGMQSGGVDVIFHAGVIGRAIGWFRRVIVSELSAANSVPVVPSYVENPGEHARLLANFTDCNKSEITNVAETEALFDCLRTKTPSEIFQASLKVATVSAVAHRDIPMFPIWGPSIDGELITFDPSLFYNPPGYRYRTPKTADILLGVRNTDHDFFDRLLIESGFFFAANLTPPVTKLPEKILKANILPRFFNRLKNRDYVVKAALQEYFADLPPAGSFDSMRKVRFQDMCHDIFSYSSILGLAKRQAQSTRGKTFVYHFTQDDPTPSQGQTLARSQEQTYVFGDIVLVDVTKKVRPNVTMDPKEKITKLDKDLTLAMINYFANFIKFG